MSRVNANKYRKLLSIFNLKKAARCASYPCVLSRRYPDILGKESPDIIKKVAANGCWIAHFGGTKARATETKTNPFAGQRCNVKMLGSAELLLLTYVDDMRSGKPYLMQASRFISVRAQNRL